MTIASDSNASHETPTGLNAFRPQIAYVSYYVEDIERALSFYVGVLGMKEQMRLDIGHGEREVVLAFPDGKGAGLILVWKDGRQEPYVRGDGYSRFVLRVSDVDAAVEALSKRGTKIKTPPTDVGAMRFAMAHDPDGYVIELLHIRRT